MGRKYIPLAIKQRLRAMPCVVCGARRRIWIDHIIPHSKGGSDDESNLQPLCKLCNTQKGNRFTTEQLIAYKKNRGNGRWS